MSENLNDTVTVTVSDADVITVPIDDTLTESGAAADAKAVGDALALKADRSELANAINVNGQPADLQGNIIVDGTEIAMSGTDSTTIRDAIAAQSGKTGETIPLNTNAGAPTIAEAVEGISGQTAETIPMRTDSTTTIAAKIETMDTVASGNTAAITALQNKTGETIMISGDSTKTVKEAVEERALTVNGEAADSTGNVSLKTVPFAQNLESELNRTITETFMMRTSGGAASVNSSDAWLLSLKGDRIHEGFVPEEISMTATGCTASVDRDEFVEAVPASTTISLSYEDGVWDTDPDTYGITVTGTPSEGATIVVEYTKEEAGTITVADPAALVATGWNLYDHAHGYAEVIKYSEDHGFGISGTYTKIEYSATESGTKTEIEVTDGLFEIPADGFVHVTGGNNTDTAIWMTWGDWEEGYTGSWEAYSTNSVSVASVMSAKFPNGLMRVGDVRDEINLSTGEAISRIDRMNNTSANMAIAKASGRAFEYDENYIYIVKETETVSAISVSGAFTANDHGMEFITGTTIGVWTQCLYGQNLKNKLERDVLTISEQDLTATQKAQVLDNIGAGSAADVAALADGKLGFVLVSSVSGSSSKTYKMANDTKAIFVTFGSTLAVKGLWIVNLANTGVTIADIASASGLTMTSPSNGKVTIANSANVGARVYAIIFAGSVEDDT